MECSKSDWKLFQDRLRGWQESYMEQLVKKYVDMLSGPEPASSKFWQLERRKKTDRVNPGVALVLDKQMVIRDIVNMINIGVITIDDLQGFSEDLINEVKRVSMLQV